MRKDKMYRIPGISLLFLLGIGISNIGDWIYLIAYNLIILNKTGDPLAVAALYMLKPVAVLVTNGWAGSMVDRMNKKKLMIVLDSFRGLLLMVLPIFTSLAGIYFTVLLINMASAIFYPASLAYITKLIPEGDRHRFNALRSLMDSGAFLIGPALAGLLLMTGPPLIAVYLNGITFIFSAVITLLLPDLENKQTIPQREKRIGFSELKADWKLVRYFSTKRKFVFRIYMIFSSVIVMTAAIDSLEAAFATQELLLSDFWYGVLVSVAGGGIIVGAIINTLLADWMKPLGLIGAGSVSLGAGYLVYAFSSDFLFAGIGFFILSFSLAFADTGFTSFIQKEVPVELLGRISSIYGLAESLLILFFTGAFGLFGQVLSVRSIVVTGSVILFILSLVLFIQTFKSPIGKNVRAKRTASS